MSLVRFLLSLIIYSFAFVYHSHGQIVINEVMSSNFRTISDEDADFEDWIEIFNTGTEKVNLLNYSISDNPSNPQKWIFPDFEIEPNEYLIVWASGKDRKPQNGYSNGLNRHVFLNISGVRTTDLTSHPKYPDNPDIKTTLAQVFASPINVGDNYGQRIFGYLIPDVSGDYQFGLSGDDYSQLYLSTDDLPENLQLIANVPGWTMPDEWNKYSSQTSRQIRLEAGKKYFIEAIMKEGTGGDHIIVRWRTPGKEWETPMSTSQLFIKQGTLHTNYKLSASGETLGLYDPKGEIIDQVVIPSLRTDISYGRTPNATGDFTLFLEPTPGKENTTQGFNKVLSKPTFSHRPGIFNENISLEILHDDPEATIIYTLDGSLPHDNNGSVYSQPLSINNTLLVRAIASKNNELPSEILAGSFSVSSVNFSLMDSNLPLMVIQQFDTLIDNSEKRIAYMTLVDKPNGDNRYEMHHEASENYRIDIEIRGSSSQSFPKKGYGLHILNENGSNRKVKVLGMPEEHNWVLHGPYSDKSLIRNHLAYELSEDMGHYAPRTRLVELYLHSGHGQLVNAHYHGVYLLVERIKIAPGRLDLQEVETYHTELPEISGGYIIKNDRLNPGESGLRLNYGQNFAFVRPNEQTINEAQKAWLKSYLEEFNTVLNSTQFSDEQTGYKKYIDDHTFIDYHLHTELFKQIDGYRFSTFMHIDRNGKLKMGPVWDYNLSWGNADYLEGGIPEGWYYPNISKRDYLHGWYDRLFEDPAFTEKYKQRYSQLRQNVFSNEHIIGKLREKESNVKEASLRNFQRWIILGQYIWPNFFVAQSHDEEIDWMEEWMKRRLAWMDTQLLVDIVTDSTELIHYWNFNNAAELLTPSFTVNDGNLTIDLSEGSEFISGTGQGFSGANARLGDEAGAHLRVNNPIGSSLDFHISTARFKDIIIQYETRRSGSGANIQYLSYSLDGNTYIPYDTLIVMDAPLLYKFDMTDIDDVNNNTNFKFKIEVDYVDIEPGGTVGNNRWDNFTVEGIPIAGENQAPTLIRIVERWDIIQNNTIDSISLTTLFSDPEGDDLSYDIAIGNDDFIEGLIVDNKILLTGIVPGETTITLTATDIGGLSVSTTIPVVIYPRFCPAATQDCVFDTWNADSPEYTYPEYMIFMQSRVNDPTLDAEIKWPYYIPHNDYAGSDSGNIGFPYRNESRTRINGLGNDGIAFINTGRGRDVGAAIIHINTQDTDSLFISFTAGTLRPNSRVYHLRLQYQIGLNSDWKDVINSDGTPMEYIRSQEAPHTQRFENIILPEVVYGKEEVFLRWIYYFTGDRITEDSGARDMLTLDDIFISTSRSVRSHDLSDLMPLKVYPNPVAQGHLYINQQVSGTVYNSMGQVMDIVQKQTYLDIAGYGTGMYLLRSNDGRTVRFVVSY